MGFRDLCGLSSFFCEDLRLMGSLDLFLCFGDEFCCFSDFLCGIWKLDSVELICLFGNGSMYRV